MLPWASLTFRFRRPREKPESVYNKRPLPVLPRENKFRTVKLLQGAV